MFSEINEDSMSETIQFTLEKYFNPELLKNKKSSLLLRKKNLETILKLNPEDENIKKKIEYFEKYIAKMEVFIKELSTPQKNKERL
ncbi:hypothetical protein AD998_21230 [bacterium 336/3]|nr:hypothetical protein AD998_21230 [bacterium 336/3]